MHTAVFAAPDARSLSAGKLCFIENKGQVTDQYSNARPDIDFKISAGNGLTIFIGSGQIHYQWSRPAGDKTELYRMDVSLLNGNREAVITFEDKQPFYEQYYTHLSGENGIRAYGYKKIIYQNVYPNIDWVFYVNKDDKLEHDFIVRPGGKVSDIQLRYDGAASLAIDDNGRLQAITPLGAITENAPYTFQQDGKAIASRFVLEENMLRFNTAAYQGILTIDPVLEWGTYFGGNSADRGRAVSTDHNGNVYIAGITKSTANIATQGAFLTTYAGGNNDAFIAKFHRDGDCRWATYYGGTNVDNASSVSCDLFGNVYAAGFTNSAAGISTPGAFRTSKAGTTSTNDAFLVKLDSLGNRAWGTYFGGSGQDGNANTVVTCDSVGNVYLCGDTQSDTGIVKNSQHRLTRAGSLDVFLSKFSTNGDLEWSTYYGGSARDVPYGIAIGSADEVIITGSTVSSDTNIATPGSYRTTPSGGQDLFLVKFNSQGQRIWGTYYGGNQDDIPRSVSLDPEHNIVVAGFTASDTGIATTGSHQPAMAPPLPGEFQYGDGFLVKFSSQGQRIWGTYFGGESLDDITGVTTDESSIIYLAGVTASHTDIATSDGYQVQQLVPNGGLYTSGFFAKLSPQGNRIYGSYYGGDNNTAFDGIKVDELNNVYLTGETVSGTHISTPNSHQTAFGGGDDDAILIRFNDCNAPDMPDTINGSLIACSERTSIYYVAGSAGVSHYTWILPNGWSGQSISDTIYIVPDTNGGDIRVIAHNFCGRASDTQTLHVTVSAQPEIVPAGTVEACAGDTVILSSSAPGITYWLKDGVTLPNSQSATLRIDVSGTYQVIAENGVCTDTSNSTTAIFHPLPSPVLVNNNGILSTTIPYEEYQWYFDGNAVTGATQPTYSITFDGIYAVQVRDSNSCYAFSDDLAIRLAVIDPGSRDQYLIFPNPVQDDLTINSYQHGKVRISTPEGRRVIYKEIIKGVNKVGLSDLPDGMYLLQIENYTGQIVFQEKLVKL